MKPSNDDIVEIQQLLSLWGHVVDNHEWDKLADLFTEDAVFDSSIFGFEPASGIAAIRDMASQEGHAIAHHLTNIYIQEGTEEEVTAQSKGLGLLSDGSLASVTYVDTLRKISTGWRITHRVLILQATSHNN